MNMAGISRLGLYIIIPPFAWLGAAFVEVALDSYLDLQVESTPHLH